MKAYRVEVLIIDLDGLGEELIKTVLESTRYPNHCLSPEVKSIECKDIGEWHDEHPLNKTCSNDFYKELFLNNKEEK
jgi:hypothetical protein